MCCKKQVYAGWWIFIDHWVFQHIEIAKTRVASGHLESPHDRPQEPLAPPMPLPPKVVAQFLEAQLHLGQVALDEARGGMIAVLNCVFYIYVYVIVHVYVDVYVDLYVEILLHQWFIYRVWNQLPFHFLFWDVFEKARGNRPCPVARQTRCCRTWRTVRGPADDPACSSRSFSSSFWRGGMGRRSTLKNRGLRCFKKV